MVDVVLRVQLLGEMTVAREGAPVHLPVPFRRLFVFLTLRPGPHGREALAVRFWPDAPVPNARASLRTAVWSLRRTVGADAVLATWTAVGLRPEALWVDAGQVATTAAGDPAGAMALCGGELLPHLTDDWVRETRDEHRALHLDLLDRLADTADSADDAGEAPRLSRLRCAMTPLDEPAHRALLGTRAFRRESIFGQGRSYLAHDSPPGHTG